MPEYQVSIEAEFRTTHSNATALKQKLLRLIKIEGFDEKNFEIGITLIKKKKDNELV